jgi:hypothetical protein
MKLAVSDEHLIFTLEGDEDMITRELMKRNYSSHYEETELGFRISTLRMSYWEEQNLFEQASRILSKSEYYDGLSSTYKN